MKTLKELYRIGIGPSSSHTMGPRKAAEMFLEKHPEAASFEVTLYGSLAATGKGHMTDVAILDTLTPHAPVDLKWAPEIFLPFHPNGMLFKSKDAEGKITDEKVSKAMFEILQVVRTFKHLGTYPKASEI